MKEQDLLLGFLVGIRNNLEIPSELMDFLSNDDQGMEGLEFMLKDAKLCTRIPRNVRYNYEILYCNIMSSLENQILDARNTLDEIEKNPEKVIHSIIQSIYESKKDE